MNSPVVERESGERGREPIIAANSTSTLQYLKTFLCFDVDDNRIVPNLDSGFTRSYILSFVWLNGSGERGFIGFSNGESTGEPDRKRRHFGPISQIPAAVKKHPFSPLSEDKKIDVAVLQYQNQKLNQKLEIQKVEHIALETNFCQWKEKQQPYDETLVGVTKSWEELVDGL